MHRSRGDSLDVVSEYGLAGGQPGSDGGLRRGARSIGDLLVAEYGALMTYSRRLTSNGPEARDLVQMLCARVLAQAATMVEPDDLSSWLRTALFRLFVDFRRRAKREIPMHFRDVGDVEDVRHVDGPALQIADLEPEIHHRPITLDDVRSLLAALPAHYRVPYEMFSFEGMSYEQISSRLGLPSRTVGTRINRARKRLRGLLQPRER
jgi:RNA polymerase sigma factor (sigma-70 family)